MSSEGWQPLRRLVDVLNAHPRPAGSSSETDSEADLDAVRSALRPHTQDVGRYDDEALIEIYRAAERLRPVVATRDVGEAARTLNTVFAESAGVPRLSGHDGSAWHLHVDGPRFSWHTWFLASSAFGLALLLSQRGGIAWGVCAASGCARAFLDEGRGGGRIYCSSRCATRSRVAAHRTRQRYGTAP